MAWLKHSAASALFEMRGVAVMRTIGAADPSESYVELPLLMKLCHAMQPFV
jgi:hypothetical protein